MLKPLQIFVYIFMVCISFMSCINLQPKPAKSEFYIQPDIIYNSIFTQLDKQKEPVDALGFDTINLKPKTTYLLYHNDRELLLYDTTYARINTCKAYIDSNILIINIGSNSDMGGEGFEIIGKNNKFTIKPYYRTDLHLPDPKTTYEIINQTLILNKPKYVLSDSIFGYVDFKMIEIKKKHFDIEGIDMPTEQKIYHIGKGFFRGKIEK